jgi:hypothetical protein
MYASTVSTSGTASVTVAPASCHQSVTVCDERQGTCAFAFMSAISPQKGLGHQGLKPERAHTAIALADGSHPKKRMRTHSRTAAVKRADTRVRGY